MKIKPSKNTDEWGTPWWLFNHLNMEFDFKLDVCASPKNTKVVEQYLTKEKDGLSSGWDTMNWCNPPYSDQLPWIFKAWEEKTGWGASSVLLVKYDPSTKHGKLLSEVADEIRIPEHRIAFEGASTGATFPVAIAVVRPRLYTRKTDARILYVNYKELVK